MSNGRRIVLEEETAARVEPALGSRVELQPLSAEEEARLPAVEPVQAVAQQRPALGRTLLAGLVLGGALLLLQSVHGLYALLRESPVLGIAWSLAFVLVAGAAGRAAWRTGQTLRAQRHLQQVRARAEYLLAHEGVSEGEGFCEELARQAEVLQSAECRRWKEMVNATHNNREVLQLYGRVVLAEADRRALERVSSHAGDVAVMVAVSYFPAVDMLLVLWRQLKLVEEVSAVYGVDPGYWGRIQLLRKVLRNMALAGAAEIATEVGVEALGAGAAAKLSGAMAQGIAAGVLTARLGIRTMDACRAIPWEEAQRPRLRQVTAGVMEKARRFLENSP
jgi:putative membrane protein